MHDLRTVFASAALALACLAGCASGPHAPRALPLAEPPRVLVVGTHAEMEAAVDSARVVCVGELHDQRPHHDFQRDVLERMAWSGGPLLLGMEMFQRPIQKHLDAYVAGEIDELEMLRRTEYFQRWNFDHTMYAPLWRFCRDHGIRIVALNPDGPINRKVGRGGIASLTPEERAGIAKDIDLTDEVHRKRILSVFQGGVHPMPEAALTNMVQAMTVWDETMAESAANALDAAPPGARMLIVAGSQHIQEYTGVPNRLARRIPGLAPLVLVCRVAGQDADPGVSQEALGHFVVVTPPGDLGEAPKMGVQFRENSMVIDKVVPGGNAERIGLRAGDRIRQASSTDGKLIDTTDLTALRYVLGQFWVMGGKGGLIVWERDGEIAGATSYDIVQPAPQPAPARP